MQSWILDHDFYKSASMLDRFRLQANIYENIHGLASLLKINNKLYRLNKETNKIEQLGKRSVANHPNIKRWEDFKYQYFKYILAHVKEWIKRGYVIGEITKNNLILLSGYILFNSLIKIPSWVNENLIKQHQEKLYNKNPEYYKQFKGY